MELLGSYRAGICASMISWIALPIFCIMLTGVMVARVVMDGFDKEQLRHTQK